MVRLAVPVADESMTRGEQTGWSPGTRATEGSARDADLVRLMMKTDVLPVIIFTGKLLWQFVKLLPAPDTFQPY